MKNCDESELNKCVKERKLLQFRLVITNSESGMLSKHAIANYRISLISIWEH